MSRHRVLVVGSGGREHALAWRLACDPGTERVLVAPGNPGIARGFTCLPIREDDAAGLVGAAREHGVTLLVFGPEGPLAAGVADHATAAGVRTFGASRDGARLESSKWHAKEVMREAGVPTSRAEAFHALEPATAALKRFGPPWVLKADGLAAGKGVCVTADRAEAERFLAASLDGSRFGASGRCVLLEGHLAGEELSVMAVCDGTRFVLLPAARDYKRALDGDAGDNTGGMGGYAPAAATAALMREVGETIVAPVLATMARRGTPYRGALYCGLMLTPAGPQVIEFNARFGDPETQSIVCVTEGDWTHLLASAADGELDPDAVRQGPGAAVTVTLAAEGYPGAPRPGGLITGLESLRAPVRVFAAGVEPAPEGWHVRGGRAAYLTATGADRATAREEAMRAVGSLGGHGWRTRSDIAAGVPAGSTTGGDR